MPRLAAYVESRFAVSPVESGILRRNSARGHSADVSIDLLLDGRTIPVGQAGGNVLIFDQPILLPPATGELIITIDGQEQRWPVSLHPDGAPSRVVAATLHTKGRPGPSV